MLPKPKLMKWDIKPNLRSLRRRATSLQLTESNLRIFTSTPRRNTGRTALCPRSHCPHICSIPLPMSTKSKKRRVLLILRLWKSAAPYGIPSKLPRRKSMRTKTQRIPRDTRPNSQSWTRMGSSWWRMVPSRPSTLPNWRREPRTRRMTRPLRKSKKLHLIESLSKRNGEHQASHLN